MIPEPSTSSLEVLLREQRPLQDVGIPPRPNILMTRHARHKRPFPNAILEHLIERRLSLSLDILVHDKIFDMLRYLKFDILRSQIQTHALEDRERISWSQITT